LTSSQNVVVGSLLGFFMPIILAMLVKRSQNAKQADEI
jgi:ABC-type nitrate/sulfonate/bicarbonate transport system permease component